MPAHDDASLGSTFVEWNREVGTDLYPTAMPDLELPVYGFVLVVIPAHNEGERITATLQSLREQTRHADAIIVVADNCSDDTITLESQPVKISDGLSSQLPSALAVVAAP